MNGRKDEPGRPANYWIFSPAIDITFVLLTPLPILLAFGAAQAGGWTGGLVAFVFSLAMAHYLPGILRAYGDRALFKRFRTRLILAPLFLIMTTAGFAYLNLNFMFLLVGIWGAWHWLMQVYGFARIYDAKVDEESRTPGWMDQILCVLWFGLCMFVLSSVVPMYVTRFYESGGPALPAAAFEWLSRVWLALTMAFLAFYAGRTVRAIRCGRPPNPVKFLLLAVTFVYLAYTVRMIDQPLTGYAMFESWHDVQYLTIVWLFNLNRARKNPEAGRFIRFLFRPRMIMVAAYVGLCLAFGSLTHAWRLFDDGINARLAFALVMAAALLHYYLDGFIWKIRDKETREGLGVQAGKESLMAPALIPIWARHAFLWLLFVIPAAVLLVMESRADTKPLQIFETLVATFPSSPQAHHELGKHLQEAGRLQEATVHFERALALEPGLSASGAALGGLLAARGEGSAAKVHLERVLKVEPENAQAHNNLGIAFHVLDDLPRAREQFELAAKLDPQYALAHNNLGIVLAKLGDLSQARVHHEEAIRISPQFADAHYQLGLTLATAGNLEEAASRLQQALRIDPAQSAMHNSLGAVLANQGKLAEARASFEHALRIKPDYAEAQQNLAWTEQKILSGK